MSAAKGGAKKKPATQKVTEGSFRKDRTTGGEHAQSAAAAEPPEWLGEREREWFAAIAERLTHLQLNSLTYSDSMALAAARLAEIELCNESIDYWGRVYDSYNLNGDLTLKANPAVGQRNEAMRHLHTLLAEFGLTPSAIQKVGATSPSTGNRFDGY